MQETVVVLGASENPERYSNKAVIRLTANGHRVLPVSPKAKQVEGISCYKDLASIDQDVDTATIYVRPSILEKMIDDVVNLKPRRVILNPGTESETARSAFEAAGIRVIQACTLVLLATGQFLNDHPVTDDTDGSR